ncbi:unnamed protein product, partial [Timema podura]|nr:unnamed protein product [Timema podura]
VISLNLIFQIDWKEYFDDAMRHRSKKIKPDYEMVVVYAPGYLKDLSSLIMNLNNTNENNMSLTGYLSKAFRDAYKGLRKALVGSEGGEESWRYCVSDTNNVIGFAIGAMFVREVFHGNSKPMAEDMINEIREAFKRNLKMLSWMDQETREAAERKADAITDMIEDPKFQGGLHLTPRTSRTVNEFWNIIYYISLHLCFTISLQDGLNATLVWEEDHLEGMEVGGGNITVLKANLVYILTEELTQAVWGGIYRQYLSSLDTPYLYHNSHPRSYPRYIRTLTEFIGYFLLIPQSIARVSSSVKMYIRFAFKTVLFPPPTSIPSRWSSVTSRCNALASPKRSVVFYPSPPLHCSIHQELRSLAKHPPPFLCDRSAVNRALPNRPTRGDKRSGWTTSWSDDESEGFQTVGLRRKSKAGNTRKLPGGG